MASDSSSIIPSCFAIATAVSLWSPVIIIGLIPADLHSSIAGFTSGRTGSIIPVKPTKHNSCSRFSELVSWGSSSQVLFAAESTRSAWLARCLLASSISLRTSSVNSCSLVPSQYVVQRDTNTSGAPFVYCS